jgi:hypothetical protein
MRQIDTTVTLLLALGIFAQIRSSRTGQVQKKSPH